MLDCGSGELIGRDMLGPIHDESEIIALAAELGIAPGPEALFAAISREAPSRRDWSYVPADRSRLMVPLRVAAIADEDELAGGYIAIATDITQRRTAEGALRESREHDIVGRALPAALVEGWADAQHHYIAGLDGASATFEVSSPGGERVFETQVAPHTVGGGGGGLLSVSRDVTERRTDETRLREQRRLLAALLAR